MVTTSVTFPLVWIMISKREVSTLIRKQYRAARQVRMLRVLLARARSDGNLRLWQRARGVLLYLEQRGPQEVAVLLEVGLKSVYRWLHQYSEHGVDGLLEGDHPGRPPSLGDDQSARLEDILDSGPVAYGLNTGIWTCPAIQHVIEEEFGITYHHDHVRKILHSLGFSVHRPGKKLALAEPELQQRWVRRTYPALKKSAARHAE